MHKVVHIEGGKRVEQKPRSMEELKRIMTMVDVQTTRPQNEEFMIAWCRSRIPGFADMHDRALASKLGGTKT